jgi:hypothetical protein
VGSRKDPVEDAAVKMQMRVQRRTEAVDEDHRAQAGRGAAAGTVRAQAALDGAQQEAQDHALQGRIVVQEIAQPLRYGEDPLAHRQRRQHVIGQMRRRLDHAPGFARESNQEVVPALSAKGARIKEVRIAPRARMPHSR